MAQRFETLKRLTDTSTTRLLLSCGSLWVLQNLDGRSPSRPRIMGMSQWGSFWECAPPQLQTSSTWPEPPSPCCSLKYIHSVPLSHSAKPLLSRPPNSDTCLWSLIYELLYWVRQTHPSHADTPKPLLESFWCENYCILLPTFCTLDKFKQMLWIVQWRPLFVYSTHTKLLFCAISCAETRGGPQTKRCPCCVWGS